MKRLILFILLAWANLSFSQFEEEIAWPEKIYSNSVLYRGQNTGYLNFKEMIDILLDKKKAFISSRLFRSVQKLHPNKEQIEIAALVDKQVEHYRKERLLSQITFCHAGVYDCDMPTVAELQGVIFKDEQLPANILEAKQRQISGGRLYTSVNEAETILSFFDPIVSTSWSNKIAKKFAHDRNGNKGYVLFLQDFENRNCSLKRKSEARCFINHEEYLEELEYPFYGYASGNEFYGFERFGVKIQRTFQDRSTLELSFPVIEKSYKLIEGKKGFLGLFWNCPRGAIKFYRLPPVERSIIRALRKHKLVCAFEQNQ